MATRKKIALIYSTDYNQATGIVIYLQNIVKHFAALENSIKPELLILYTSNSPIEELKQLQYPFARYIQLDKKQSIVTRALNKISRILIKRNLFSISVFADFAFPVVDAHSLKRVKQFIFWKEDFQENYYPEFFRKEAFEFVKHFFAALQTDKSSIVVLSSYTAGEDLKKFYPDVKNKVHYLRFVSLLPALDDEKLSALLQKHKIIQQYFIVCNQFWPHKNHLLVLQAALALNKMGIKNYQIVFTGKVYTSRNAEYFPKLKSFIDENNLSEQIIITDFLPREEQLLLMKHSLSVIQPSLFEGWSTVIEDAKALNKYILATNLPVNKEQVNKNISFFQQDDPAQLAELMNNCINGNFETEPTNYQNNISDFRNSLTELFSLKG